MPTYVEKSLGLRVPATDLRNGGISGSNENTPNIAPSARQLSDPRHERPYNRVGALAEQVRVMSLWEGILSTETRMIVRFPTGSPSATRPDWW